MAIDSVVPIQNTDALFKVWNYDEIYRGDVITGRYVPNEGDLVFSAELGFFIVIAVDPSTGLSTLDKWTNPVETTEGTNVDTFVGSAVGTVSESFRVFIDPTVIPHTMACDSRLHIYGSSASTIKVFKGTDISSDGIVISAMYDGAKNFLGENIPLELVSLPNSDNIAIKTPVVGYTTFDVLSGETVTVVVYDDLGHVLSYSTMVVVNTSFIRSTEAGRKYITSIHIESPFLDVTDERVLKFPINMTVSEIPAIGVVTYSDGSTLKAPVNTGGFKLLGLEQFISTVVGQRIPLVLNYTLSESEYAYGLASAESKTISVPYFAQTTPYEKSFAIKMFIYPEWVDSVTGYKLNFYLSVLGGAIVDVTDLVSPTSISATWDGTKYATTQQLSFSVQMSDVSPVYSVYTFVQSVEVTLLAPGNTTGAAWAVAMSPNQTPPYGIGLIGKVQTVNGSTTMNLMSGFSSETEWLDNVYLNSEPLFNSSITTGPETPNVMVVEWDGFSSELLTSEWNTEFPITTIPANGSNVKITFIYRSTSGDVPLGISSFPIVIYPSI